MKLKFLFFIFLLSGVTGCAYQEPQLVIIDSNVTAFVYQGDKQLGETPFAGRIPRSEIGNLYLKRHGYKTTKIPARKVNSRGKEILTPALSSAISDDFCQELETEKFIALTTVLPSMPTLTLMDVTHITTGQWIEYVPNSFYVEMIPDGLKSVTAELLQTVQIKEFALKMYPALKTGDRDAVTAMAALSDASENQVELLAVKHSDPVSFAEAVANL